MITSCQRGWSHTNRNVIVQRNRFQMCDCTRRFEVFDRKTIVEFFWSGFKDWRGSVLRTRWRFEL
jgi:hypothetical protein